MGWLNADFYYEGDRQGNDPEYPPPPSPSHDPVDGAWMLNIGRARKFRLAELNSASQLLANQALSSYPEFETKTWEDQRREAVAWGEDNNAATPYIDALSGFRQMDRVEYIQRTLAKITAFTAFSTRAVGLRQKYADMIDAAMTEEQLYSIVFDFS